ncbi:MAG: nucleotidyl transferase AbiEii/AbiGii toxin family protein [Desulfobacterales bacterium]|nr:nucleotidyl transferase AbiEii/AbiGii toxin family protein [Desulfobacterales bacterium]
MRISSEMLTAQAEATGFRMDTLEKVGLLIHLLGALQSHPFLKGRLALKGGTALNLFIFDVPRLSIDIDLNYVGASDREVMLLERPKVDTALQAVFSREGFTVRRMPGEHAGGKWQLRYQGASGQGGILEVDVNFVFRVSLWPHMVMASRPVGVWQATDVQILDIHELAAGKLAALFSRRQARDLFDSSHLFRSGALESERLRLAFVLYGAMNRRDWRTVDIEEVSLEIGDFEQKLLPMLRAKGAEAMSIVSFRKRLIEDCRKGLAVLLPFKAAEMEFLDRLLEKGEIVPDLLTDDEDLRDRIRKHPMLEWKALNVREFIKNQ